MTQRDLFTPPACPCGCGPYVHQDGEDWVIGLWCYCPVEQWVAPTLPEVMDKWEEALGMMERGHL